MGTTGQSVLPIFKLSGGSTTKNDLCKQQSSVRITGGGNFCVREDIFGHLESLRVASSSVTSVSSLIQVTPCCFTTESHPCPPKPDPAKSLSSSLNNLTPAKFTPVINNGSPTILGKRSYEQHNGMDGKYFSAVCPLRS